MIEPSEKDGGDTAPGRPEPDHLPAGGAPGLSVLQTGNAGSIDGLGTLPALETSLQDDVKRLNAAALAAFSGKNYLGAVELFESVVALDPASAAAHSNLAAALRRTERTAEAEAQCRRAIALSPDHVPAYMNLAEVLGGKHDIAGALACYDKIVRIAPNYVMAHNNAGLLLRKVGRFGEAEAAFSRALALKPGDLAIRFNQLMTRRDDVGLPEAVECCRRTLEQRPDAADVLINLAVALHLSGHYDEAMIHFERALAISPQNHEAHFNLSLLLLLLGEYDRGWRVYEQRWRLIEVNKPKLDKPEWQGESLDGKTILLHFEQGLGDTIQCLRYVPLVAARGGRVVLRLERSLVRLAASLTDNVVISPTGARLPPFDVWCPLLSLPRIFGTQLDSIPAAAPYLAARPAVAERWARRLAGLTGLRVGLVWSGNARHINDFRRSIDFQRLRPLFDVSGVSWVSLQVGQQAAELAALPPGNVTDLSAELTDFVETTGAIRNLDLVIAVDTAVAHLAGAIAKPTWLMLAYAPDWRWLLDRDDSPWYPSLRLYRQRALSDWDGVIARVAADLARHVAGRSPRISDG